MAGKVRRPSNKVVQVDGYNIVTYSYGEGEEVLLCLNGGPGLACDYLRDALSEAAEHGYRVVAYDQLGCGQSDKPKDKRLWTITRYTREVEAVRKTLGLGKVHLLGHSWGGWLGIEYAITYNVAIKTCILASTCGDMPHLIEELNRLREALGSETVAMMLRHEAAGTLDHPEYQAAITILNYRHVCRLQDWPAPVQHSLKSWNMDVYGTMQGPNEFLYTGNLKDWNRISDMRRITQPCLITVGMHDELPPSCAMRMHQALPDAKVAVFQNSAHLAHWEEREKYLAVLLEFLNSHRDEPRKRRGAREAARRKR